MVLDISYPNADACVREIHMGDKEPRTIVTLGNCSYLAQANFDFELRDFCHVLIGNYCSLAHRITFELGTNHDYHKVSSYPFTIRVHPDLNAMELPPNKQNKYQILIGNDVWIGCDVMLFGGVRVGNGAVIAANSVVTKDVPPYAVVAGNPAKIIKYRFSKDVIQKLQHIKWWYWPESKILTNLTLMDHPEYFVHEFYPKSIQVKRKDTVYSFDELKKAGYKIFYFIVDFQSQGEIWPEVLQQYLMSFHASDSTVLLLGVEHTDEIVDEMQRIVYMVEHAGEKSPAVMTVATGSQVDIEVLSVCTYFITSREGVSSVGIDYADSYGVKILSGLSADIFENTLNGVI